MLVHSAEILDHPHLSLLTGGSFQPIGQGGLVPISFSVMKTPRLSSQTLLLLERFLDRPSAWRYGYELSRETGLKSGTVQ